MSGLNKHSITETESTSQTPSKKFKQDSIPDCKVENYITEEQINDMIKKCETYSVEKRTCAVFDLNTISTVTHNIVINPESGEVESIVRKEYDKSTTPQCFFITPQNNTSLDIIQEETDVDSCHSSDSETSSVRRCTISTQTDFESEVVESKPESSICRLKKSQTLTSNLNVCGFENESEVLNDRSISFDDLVERQSTEMTSEVDGKLIDITNSTLEVENKPPDKSQNTTIAETSTSEVSTNTSPQIRKTLQFIFNEQKGQCWQNTSKTTNCDDLSNEAITVMQHQPPHSRPSSQNSDRSTPTYRVPEIRNVIRSETSTSRGTIGHHVPVNQMIRSETSTPTSQVPYNISCDKCGSNIKLKYDNLYSSNDSLHSSNRNLSQNVAFNLYPPYTPKTSTTNLSSSSNRYSTASSTDYNSTYSMSSDSMSIALKYDSSSNSLNRHKSASSGALSRNSPYSSLNRDYDSRRIVPPRHSSYNALSRHSMNSALSSSSTSSTLSRDSRASQNSMYGTITRSTTSGSNSDKMALYSLPNKQKKSDIDNRLAMLRKNIQKSFSTPSIYKTGSISSDTSYEVPHRRPTKSHAGNPATDELTNSLNELSKKYDAYIKNKEYVESSSDTNTDSTVRYVPDDLEGIKFDEPEYVYVPEDRVPTLKKLSLKAILSFQNGIDLLSNIYFVPPQKSTHLTKLIKGTTRCQHSHHAPRLQPRKTGKPIASNLYDMHQKFTERRGYFENQRPQSKTELLIEDIYSPKTPRSCIFNVDENYTKELLEEAANLLALRKYRETRIRGTVNRHYLNQNFDLVTYKVETPTLSSRVKSNRVKHDEPYRSNSQHQHLELIQNKKQLRTINQIDNNVTPQIHHETKINTNRSQSFMTNVQKSHSTSTNRQSSRVVSQLAQRAKTRSQSLPADTQPDIRQVMYAEYMNKVAERFERKQKKLIRITKRPDTGPTMVKIFNEIASKEKPCTLEEEFMQKARTRLHKLGFDLDDPSSNETTEEESVSSLNEELPGHLQEFIQLSQQEIINEEGECGMDTVWPSDTNKLFAHLVI